MTKEERTVLTAFLGDGLTHREIDLTLGHNPGRSRGWQSHGILTQRFGIRGAERGALFLCPRNVITRVVREIGIARSRAPLDRALRKLPEPAVLEPYRGTFALAASPQALQRMLSGEARNAVQRFFEQRKKAAGSCQMQGCTKAERLDIVHLLRTRPNLFVAAARKHSGRDGSQLRF